MALDTCEPCSECKLSTQLARSQDTYRQAVLITLCQILAAASNPPPPVPGEVAAFVPIIPVNTAALDATTFVPVALFPAGEEATAKNVTITNNSNVAVAVTFDGADNNIIVLPQSVHVEEFYENGTIPPGDPQVRLLVAGAGTGSVYFGAQYGV